MIAGNSRRSPALALNLRFIIFSAAIAQGFRGIGAPLRWFAGHLLTDGVFACCLEKMLKVDDPRWRLGYYLAPSLWSWLLWQVSSSHTAFLSERQR